MVMMGRPTNSSNNFRNVKMTKKPNVGDELNRLSGRRRETGFVDKNQHNKIGKNEFLKLLTHQMSNQDPMKPMDQQKFAADLAQFSQLEQLANINKSIENQGNDKNQQMKFYGASFLGKEIITNGTTVDYDGKATDVNIPYYMPHEGTNVIVRIYDDKNQMISQIEKEHVPQGNNSILWDGMQNDDTVAAKGDYRVEVIAFDENMERFAGQTKSTGLVEGVEFEGNETVLILEGHKKVFLRDVESFTLPNAKSGMEKNARLNKKLINNYNNQETNATR